MANFLKSDESEIITTGLAYRTGDSVSNKNLREKLLKEQKGFCAYWEIYLEDIDTSAVEHFDPSLKDKTEDNYYNWYTVAQRFNAGKDSYGRRTKFLPLPTLHELKVAHNKIQYDLDTHIFSAIDSTETAINNLIKYLNLNDPVLLKARQEYLAKFKSNLGVYGEEEFINFVKRYPKDLSFYSTIKLAYPEIATRLHEAGTIP